MCQQRRPASRPLFEHFLRLLIRRSARRGSSITPSNCTWWAMRTQLSCADCGGTRRSDEVSRATSPPTLRKRVMHSCAAWLVPVPLGRFCSRPGCEPMRGVSKSGVPSKVSWGGSKDGADHSDHSHSGAEVCLSVLCALACTHAKHVSIGVCGWVERQKRSANVVAQGAIAPVTYRSSDATSHGG